MRSGVGGCNRHLPADRADPGPVPAHSAGTGRPAGREGRFGPTGWRPERPNGEKQRSGGNAALRPAFAQ